MIVEKRGRIDLVLWAKPSHPFSTAYIPRSLTMSTMNGASSNHAQNPSARVAKPPPAGPTPPAPAVAPPAPPNANAAHPTPSANRSNAQHGTTPTANGHTTQKGKKRNDVPVDPATMYESLKNRIAALEEEEVLEEEEERRFGTHANLSISRGFPIIS